MPNFRVNNHHYNLEEDSTSTESENKTIKTKSSFYLYEEDHDEKSEETTCERKIAHPKKSRSKERLKSPETQKAEQEEKLFIASELSLSSIDESSCDSTVSNLSSTLIYSTESTPPTTPGVDKVHAKKPLWASLSSPALLPKPPSVGSPKTDFSFAFKSWQQNVIESNNSNSPSASTSTSSSNSLAKFQLPVVNDDPQNDPQQPVSWVPSGLAGMDDSEASNSR